MSIKKFVLLLAAKLVFYKVSFSLLTQIRREVNNINN